MLALASQCALGSHFKAVQQSTKPVVFITGDQCVLHPFPRHPSAGPSILLTLARGGARVCSDEITSVSKTKEYFDAAHEPKALHVLEVNLRRKGWVWGRVRTLLEGIAVVSHAAEAQMRY
jgi:hypothetical protein